MAVVSISELKSRFITGDMPTAKDFGDLLDTLVSIKNTTVANGALSLAAIAPQTPLQVLQTDSSGNVIVAGLTYAAVTGDGSLTGTYPNLSVATNGIQASHISSQAVSLRHFNQGEGSPNGYVLTSTGSGFAWSPVSASLNLNRVAASGAVRKYKSSLIPLPTSVGGFSNPWTQNLTHGLGFTPDSFRVALVCTSASAGYAQNQEVPINLFTTSTGKPVFFTSTTSTNVNVDAAFTAGVGDFTMQVYDGTTLGNVDTLSMASGDFAKWSLVVYADVYINGDGFGAVTGWTSTPAAITATTATSTQSVTNTQGVIPNAFKITLKCVTTDGSFSVGDEVPIEAFTNSSFEPAFTAKVNTANFVITANVNAGSIQVGSTGITLANWNLVVRAILATGNAVSLQAPTALQLNGVRAAVSYKGTLYAGHTLVTNQTSGASGAYGATGAYVSSLLSSINIQNGNVTPNVISGAFPSSDLTFGAKNGSYNTFGRAQLNMVRWPAAGKNALMWIRGNDTFVSESNPVNTTAIPYGAPQFAYFYPDAASPAYATLGAVPVSGSQPALTTQWGTGTYYPYPQHLAIIQVDDTGTYPAHPDLYAVNTQYYPVPNAGFKALMNNCRFGKYTYNGSVYAFSGAVVGAGSGTNSAANAPAGAINWLNPGIVGITSRLSDIFASVTSSNPIYLNMVCYNPVKQLFYVIDSLTGMLHIYSLAVTLQSWLSTAIGGSTNLDHTQLTYNGPYVIPIGSAYFDRNQFGDNGSTYAENSMRDVWTVEFDLVSGAELSLTVVRGLSNDIIRIPWTYPL